MSVPLRPRAIHRQGCALSPDKVFNHHTRAARRQDRNKARGNFAESLVKKRSSAEHSEQQKQQRKEGQKHIKSDGLAQGDAIGEKPAKRPRQISEYGVHRCPADYTGRARIAALIHGSSAHVHPCGCAQGRVNCCENPRLHV